MPAAPVVLGALLTMVAGAVVAAPPVRSAAPEVLKVEPPSWWPGHSINPVRLLLRGRRLAGATVEAQGGGVAVSLVRANAAGSYLFVDVTIDADARPGPRRLVVRSPAGRADVPFELLAPLARRRFRASRRRRDLPHHARPLRERGSRQRRPAALAGSP
jgi:hypothetical protein